MEAVLRSAFENVVLKNPLPRRGASRDAEGSSSRPIALGAPPPMLLVVPPLGLQAAAEEPAARARTRRRAH